MDDKIIEFFYKWHRFEKQNNVAIIDFDLLQKGNLYIANTFSNHEEVEKQLKKLIIDYNDFPQKNMAVLAKLKASLFYLQALMGKSIPFSEYVQNTMGVKPRYISENFLQHEFMKLKNAFKKIGYSYDLESIDKYLYERKIAKEEIEKDFNNFSDRVLPDILQWLGVKIDLHYTVRFVDVDEYWTNWTSTDEKGNLLLQFNINKRQQWVKGITEYQVLHEICGHVLQTSIWKKKIQENKISEVLGLTSVFSQESFLLEGIGETLWYFYPNNPYSDFGIVRQYYENFSFLIWNNAHIMANEGENKISITKYVQKYLPFLKEKDIEKSIREKTLEPLGRTYQYVYGITTFYHILLAEKLSELEKKNYILDLFNNIYIPEEIINKYHL